MAIERIEMPDGTVILAQIDADEDISGTDVSLRRRRGNGDESLREGLRLENLSATVRSVAGTVKDGLVGMKADRVSVEFGLELAFDTGAVVAVLAKGGVKAAVKVKLEWDSED
ncbi:CU044_2847 family protein [Nocardia sp. XZ_19_385]|uniref:CU044_2847 family protein n=1 Tax=Nocardia sp. XZ_19_385 TaxID=2769488 RepID=UPI00188F85EB|nr:CU044_2847 family protein [Nocardia sp. XZ_19_385]